MGAFTKATGNVSVRVSMFEDSKKKKKSQHVWSTESEGESSAR